MDAILNRLASVDSPLPIWVLGSMLAYAAATNALWLAERRNLELPASSRWLIEPARFLFYIGLPYLALGGWPRRPFQGLLLLEDLGLVGVGRTWSPSRWLEALGAGLVFSLAAAVLLLLAWRSANRAAPGIRLHFPAQPWWAILIDVFYQQVHWAFYRAALAVALVDLYAGVFLGLGGVYAEWALSPFWRAGWRSEREAARQWLRLSLALVTGLLFLWTQNLWVCLAAHAGLELTFRQLGRDPAVPQPVA
jgi:hypothetical protein